MDPEKGCFFCIFFFFFQLGSIWTREINPVVVYDVMVMKNELPETVHEYRIPILAIGPLENTLVMFAEARLGSSSDYASKNIVYRYSTDKGFTWSEFGTLFESKFSGNVFNGNAVIDYETRTMFFIFNFCPLPCINKVYANYITESKDDGKTWSVPRNISSMISSFMYDGGPSLGIQKKHEPHKGRLIACGHTEPLSRDGHFCIYSDDHGKTWTKGQPVFGIPYNESKHTGDFLPDETTIVELPNGDVMANARNQYHFHCRCRFTLISRDGGETFDRRLIRMNEELLDSAVAAGLAIYNEEVLLFTNPNSTTVREQLTLKWSKDYGYTWNEGIMIWPMGAGYSSIAAYPSYDPNSEKTRVYVAYERSYSIPGISSLNVAVIDLYGQPN